ncbi:hypothetical protein EON63_23270, partial [archaeon]
MSPERLVGDKYDSSADVWSLGVSIVQLHNKQYPFTKCAETPIHLCGELENFDVYSFSAHPPTPSPSISIPISSRSSSSSPHTPPPYIPPSYTSPLKSFIRSTMARMPSDRSSCLELIRDCVWFQTYKLDGLETAQEVSMVMAYIFLIRHNYRTPYTIFHTLYTIHHTDRRPVAAGPRP